MEQALQLAARLAAQPAAHCRPPSGRSLSTLLRRRLRSWTTDWRPKRSSLVLTTTSRRCASSWGPTSTTRSRHPRRDMNTDWRKYPFRLVHDDSALDFPAAEGLHADQESDTWFIAGELTAATVRSFAFLTIFNKNRPGGTVVADFYTLSLFDAIQANTAPSPTTTCRPRTCSPVRVPRCRCPPDHLDIRYDSSAGTAAWTACRDDDGELSALHLRVSLRRHRSGRPVDGIGLGCHADACHRYPSARTLLRRQDRPASARTTPTRISRPAWQ